MRRCLFPIMLCLLVFLLSACRKIETPTREEVVSDDFPLIYQDVTIKKHPFSVVSLSPTLTEILIDLGYSGRITGRSDYCCYASIAESSVTVGSPIAPNIRRITALTPDLVLIQTPLSSVNQSALEAAGIPVAVLPHPQNFSELEQLYQTLCTLMDGKMTGMAAATTQAKRFEQLLEDTQAKGEPIQTALYVTSLSGSVATGDAFENAVLAHIGVQNLAENGMGWRLTEEELAAADPDILFIAEYLNADEVAASPAFSHCKAVQSGRVLPVNPILIERQGGGMFSVMREMRDFVWQDHPPLEKKPVDQPAE